MPMLMNKENLRVSPMDHRAEQLACLPKVPKVPSRWILTTSTTSIKIRRDNQFAERPFRLDIKALTSKMPYNLAPRLRCRNSTSRGYEMMMKLSDD